MALRDIIGQDKAVKMLVGIMERDRLAGSYLFCGESGIGKKTAAINFAKAINCLRHGPQSDENQIGLLPAENSGLQSPDLDACENCESCRKINEGIHPDILVIVPEDRMIKVGDRDRLEENSIRFIEDALSFRPFEGKKKVVIIDDADLMNQQAANAFLKTLEEPPSDSLIILVSSRPERLPSTIRSRCSRIPFQNLSSASCREILSGKIVDDDIEKASRLSHGRPGLAISNDVIEDRNRFIDLLKAMMRAEKDGWASRDEMEKWFDLAMTLMRDIAILEISGGKSYLVNADLSDLLRSLGKSVDVQRIINIYRELNYIKTMLLFNLNKSLTWNYTATLMRKELHLENA